MKSVSAAGGRLWVVFVGGLLAPGIQAAPARITEVDWAKMDDIFVGAFDWAVIAGLVLTFLFGSLLFGLLARPFSSGSWLFTRPLMRVLPMAVFAFALVAIPYVLGPVYWWSVGVWPYGGVADWYQSEEALSRVGEAFGGVLYGLIGKGRPAIAQVHYLLLVPFVGCTVGACLAALLSRFWSQRQWKRRGDAE